MLRASFEDQKQKPRAGEGVEKVARLRWEPDACRLAPTRGASSFLECGGKGNPTLYQDSWRRRFGPCNFLPGGRRQRGGAAQGKAASPGILLIRRRIPFATLCRRTPKGVATRALFCPLPAAFCRSRTHQLVHGSSQAADPFLDARSVGVREVEPQCVLTRAVDIEGCARHESHVLSDGEVEQPHG